jgi:hypothetical protein
MGPFVRARRYDAKGVIHTSPGQRPGLTDTQCLQAESLPQTRCNEAVRIQGVALVPHLSPSPLLKG